jgi:multidrug efflux pump
MPAFFIDRPVFAWVVALLICLRGLLAIPFLAVAQYPIVAPPSISVSTSYPGASPENLYNSVTRLIEEELNGANGILNFASTSDSLGQAEITANFVPGTDSESASIEVQNRIKRVEARLPRAVIQQGILIEEASSAVLQIITLRSTDGSLDEVGLGDFLVRNIFGRDSPHPGRRAGDALLHRACASHLDRSEPVGRVQPDGRRCDQGGKLAKRAGRVRQHRGRAQLSASADIGAGPGQGPIRFAR